MKQHSVTRGLMMEMVVGGFMVLIFAGLVYFTIILSREAWFRQKYALEVRFGDVIGLRAEDNVVVRGMTVGKVKSLALQPDGVHVYAALDKRLCMRSGYRIEVVSTSILGGRYLRIEEGAGEELPGGVVYDGAEAHDLMADAAELASAFRQAFTAGGILTNLERTVAGLSEVAESLRSGKGTLGKLFSDETLYRDISSTVASLKTIAARLEKGEGTAGRLLSQDEQLYQDISATASSLKTITARLEKGEGTLGRLLTADDQLYRDLSATAASMKNIAGKIERGEGTLGRLAQDDALYTDLKAAVRELRGAVDDFRENTPVVTFTSILFGAF